MRLLTPVAFSVIALWSVQARASFIDDGYTIYDTFNFIDSHQANDAGISVGTRISFGLDVNPVGTQPTPSADGTTVVAQQGSARFTIPYLFSPALPNQFYASIDYASHPALTGSWALTLTNPTVNGGLSATVSTPSLATTIPPPFVTDVELVPNGLTPTITWSIPAASSANRESVYVFDRTHLTPLGNSTLIYTQNIPISSTSFALPADLLTAGGEYTFAVQLDQRSPTGDLQARSRSFVDFNPAVSVPVYLPVVSETPTGPVFSFDVAVEAREPVAFDPAVATGYIYKIGTGDPLFASVELPNIGNPTPYDVCVLLGSTYGDCQSLAADTVLDFGGSGVADFEVLGISPSLGLDPSDPTAFVTTLTFENAGRFTGTMTPISVTSVVPEPGGFAVFLLGLAGLGWSRRRRPAADELR